MSPTRTAYLIGRMDRILRTEIEQRLTDLSLNEVTTLSVLSNRPGLSNAALARRALVSPQAMIKVVASLESAGLVERATGPAGGRALEAKLTTAGVAALADANRVLDDVEAELFDRLTPGERELFRSVLLRTTGLETEAEGDG